MSSRLLYPVISLAGLNFGRNLSYNPNPNPNNTTPVAIAKTQVEQFGSGRTGIDDVISQCQPPTNKEIEDIAKEIEHYKTLSKYANKIVRIICFSCDLRFNLFSLANAPFAA